MKNKILKLLTIPLILTILILPLCSWTTGTAGVPATSFVAPFGTSLKVGYTSVITDYSHEEPLSLFEHGYIYNPQNSLVNIDDFGYSYNVVSNYVNNSLYFSVDDFELYRNPDYFSGYNTFYLGTSGSGYGDIDIFTKIDGRLNVQFYADVSPISTLWFYHNGSEVRNDELEIVISTIKILEYNSYMDSWRLITYDLYNSYNLTDFGHYGADYEIDFFTLISDILVFEYPQYSTLNYRLLNVDCQFLNMSPHVSEPDEFDFIYIVSYVIEETIIYDNLQNTVNSYQEGYRDGANSVPESWADVGTFLTDFLGAFTQAEIFPGVTIGGVLGVVVGGLLLLMFLKMFAGG